MSATLMVDKDKGLKELTERDIPRQPAAVRAMATLISYVFHPVFVPVYIMLFLLYVHPYAFAGYPARNKIIVLVQSCMMLTFFPLVTVFLLKALGFINSIYLHTQKDRIIPFIACMTWYFWLWYVWKNMGKSNDAADMPVETVRLALALFVSTIIGLMANINMKISLHAMAMGILITFFISLALSQGLSFGLYISLALLVAGLVCTARMIVADHHPVEIYTGLVAGVVSMLVANIFT